MPEHRKGKQGTKKYGRNKEKCTQYKAEGRREENKKRKAKRIQKRLEKARQRNAVRP